MRMLWRGKASAWECDEMGHLNVAYALAKACEALDELAAQLGLSSAESPRATSALMPREAHIRYLAEVRPGGVIDISGGVSRFDESSLVASLLMRHADGRAAMGFTIFADHVVTATARPFPWSSRTIAAAQDAMVEPPDETRPRSIAVDPPSSAPAESPSLARADVLGMQKIGRGVFRGAEADAFGRVRISAVHGRISESATGLARGETASALSEGRGGALVEARIVVRTPPSAGDRYVIRSGITEVARKTWRQVHWILEPASNRAWASVEAVGVRLDLEARRSVEFSDEARAALEAALVPGLTI